MKGKTWSEREKEQNISGWKAFFTLIFIFFILFLIIGIIYFSFENVILKKNSGLELKTCKIALNESMRLNQDILTDLKFCIKDFYNITEEEYIQGVNKMLNFSVKIERR